MCRERPERSDHLGRGFAWPIDDFGIARSSGPVDIQPGKSDIDNSGRAGGGAAQRIRHESRVRRGDGNSKLRGVALSQLAPTNGQITVTDLITTVVSVVALILALVAVLLLGRTRRQLRLFRGTTDEADLLHVAARHRAEVTALTQLLHEQQADLRHVKVELESSLRHVSVVRFDAFADTAGLMSFSAALLDDSGDGMLLTAINGRGETRTYGKAVTAGRSDSTLMPEEEQALAAAR